MKTTLSRRRFLSHSLAATAGLTAAGHLPSLRAASANDKINLAVIGTNSRGLDLIKGFSERPGVEIVAICDVDDRALEKGVKAAAEKQARAPRGVRDLRRVLDDRSIDAVVIAMPDHWHAPATILACAAGKHVYVEKPASHNPHEGELMVAAARKHNRVVQLGTQRRSMPGIIEAVAKLRAGEIGTVRFARGWYNNSRGTIGHGQPAPVPAWLDYALWQGPAPEREYRDNLIHYNWHWFWHWGTGELGNNGIHALDVCRWGLGVEYPRSVTSGGGRYQFADDQETPDTNVVTYDFGNLALTWEGRSCQKRGFEGTGFGCAFYGDQGSLITEGTGYRVLDPDGKEVRSGSGSGSDGPHLQNFLDCIRDRRRTLNAEIEEGRKSTLLCHLGNIAWRTGRTLHLDPQTHRIQNDKAASALWQREYRKGWEPKV